jgi:hypothetical protein
MWSPGGATVNVRVAYDPERDAWAVIVNDVAAVTFSGDHAREHAENAAAQLQSLTNHELPWFMHHTESGEA